MVGTELIVIILALVLLAAIFFLKSIMQPAKMIEVKIGNATVNAEVADTLPKQIKGLMFRSSLPQNEGMLFDFGEEDYHGIWMMNTSIPLDIIWISSDYKIISIQKDARPCFLDCRTYSPDKPARYVLEVNSGFTDKNSINIGDKVKFQ